MKRRPHLNNFRQTMIRGRIRHLQVPTCEALTVSSTPRSTGRCKQQGVHLPSEEGYQFLCAPKTISPCPHFSLYLSKTSESSRKVVCVTHMWRNRKYKKSHLPVPKTHYSVKDSRKVREPEFSILQGAFTNDLRLLQPAQGADTGVHSI